MLGFFAAVAGGVAAFFRWWGEELRGLLPLGLRQLFSRSPPRAIIATDKAGLRLYEERGAQLRPFGRKAQESAPGAAADVLPQLKRRRWHGLIGVRVPLEWCFSRTVELPASARANFRNILSLDLERATPFRAADVYTGHYVEDERPVGGKVKVRQLVVKREGIDPIIADAKALGLTIQFADSWNEDRTGGLPIDFLGAETTANGEGGQRITLRRLLAAAAALLLLLAGYLVFQRYDDALAEIQSQTGRAKTKAQAVRQALERSEAAAADLAKLQRIKLEQPSPVEVIEEITRLMPDSAWMLHLRIDKDTVDLTGLAKSGASLLSIFEHSPIFVDAKLTAPLRFDDLEDMERYSIRMRIRPAPGSQGTADGEDKG